MAKKKHKNRSSGGSGGGGRYSAGDIFVAVLGGAFLIMVVGMVLTSIFGG